MKVPGFVDLQVNGFVGIDFSSENLTEESFDRVCRELRARGTAAFLPTIITSPRNLYRRNLPIIARAMESPEHRGRVLGVHIEGPCISPEPGAVGAHNAEWVLEPSIEFFDELMELSSGRVRLLTIAAELPGAARLARHAVSRGVVVSLGHQLATDEDIAALAEAGATALTHLGNGIPNMVPRHPNTIWAGLAEDRLTGMFITDGHHLPPSFITTAFRAKGPERTVVVSDAASIAGLPPGRYQTPGAEVVLEPSGLLHEPAKGCLAGSSATMLDCMNHLASLGLHGLDELMSYGRRNPLRLIGLDDSAAAADPELEFDDQTRRFSLAEGS